MGAGALSAFVRELVDSGDVTATAAVVGDPRGIHSQAAGGRRGRIQAGRVSTSSLFDLASLTKPVTATLALALARSGAVGLEHTVLRALGSDSMTADRGIARRQLGSLLKHRAGFQAWAPLFKVCRGNEDALRYLATTPALYGAPAGLYSDLDFILWGLLVERLTGSSLARLVAAEIAKPLARSAIVPSPAPPSKAIESRLNGARERALAADLGIEVAARRPQAIGRVQDHNAASLGGLAGHAGLFGSALAMWRLAAEWLQPGEVLNRAAVDRVLADRAIGGYVLGWRKSPSATAGRGGTWFGHTGFTGGGVWFSRTEGEVRVLLAHRRSLEVKMQGWQRRFLDLSL